MKLISLTRGYEAMVDDEDYERVMNFGIWRFYGKMVTHTKNGKRNGPLKPRDPTVTTVMARLILGYSGDLQVDHINGNPLDNRKENLRVVTHTQNQWNQSKVSVRLRNNSWEARLTVNGKKYFSGGHSSYEDAEKAYFDMVKHYRNNEFSEARRATTKQENINV